MRLLSVLAVALFVHCGPPKPKTTVPAPVTTAQPASPAVAPPDEEVPKLRLPRPFVPTSYTARLAIDPRRDDFDGAISIAGTVAAPTSLIWLHGYHLKITKAIAQRDGAAVPLAVAPKGEDLLEVRAERPLEPGAWTLELAYTGEIDRVNTTGVYKQTVADHTYVYTQFEALYARRAFPCIDEPDVKVPWKLAFDVPVQHLVVSNAPQASEAPLGDGKKRVEFAQSKPLPSYLVAFGVGPFEIVDAGATKRGTPVRVIALAKRRAEAAYAAKTAARITDLAEEWFGTPYPYEKLDHLTIPLTVGFGAMENAGLITYTEKLILNDPLRPAKRRLYDWGVTAAHEVAHQWFGDLVTPVYWDDIWLNEGFANWVQTKIAAQLDPSWRADQAELEDRNHALEADALVSARQIRQPIKETGDILNAFDGITYSKGAALLHMFERYVGPDVFQRGVREYLAARAWGNATSSDFIAAIGKAAGPKVAALRHAPDAAAGAKLVEAGFSSFLEQAGAPEITATVQCSGGKASLALAQQRYVPPGALTPPAGKPWVLPICVTYDKDGARGEACTVLDQPAGSLALPSAACPRWVMPNRDGDGYYRNRYTTQQITALRDEGWEKLSWPERRALFFDVRAGVKNGAVPLQVALSIVPKLLAGADRFTVTPTLKLAAGLGEVVPAKLTGKYELYLRQTFGAAAAQAGFLGKESDTLDIEETRAELVKTVGWYAREPKLVAEAVRLVERGWRELPQAIRGLVLRIAIDARPALFERILREMPSEPDRTRRTEMQVALASTRDPARQQTALGMLLDPKVDIREALGILFRPETAATRATAQQFFREHKDELLARVPSAETSTPIAILAIAFTASCSAERREEIVDYVNKTFRPMRGGERVVNNAIEEMDQCIAGHKLIEPEVSAWLGGLRAPKPPKPPKAEPAKAKAKAKAKGSRAGRP